ncbi:hypothetical protein H0H87_006071 [Tephrocybe sp. NHM501043]|nr:hypothetical protein H0H87_006071 [Tephrocybe sp. NHM501043]
MGLSQAAAQKLTCRLFKRTSPPEQLRLYSDIALNGAHVEPDPSKVAEVFEGWLFVDSVFPIQIARWDFRHFIGLLREESLLDALKCRLEYVRAHGFKIVSLEPHKKDGGVFVRFAYTASDSEVALKTIEHELSEVTTTHGGVPSWLGLSKGKVWMVRGTPWREDMYRYASPIIKVAFDGPDVQEQTLYHLFRVCRLFF